MHSLYVLHLASEKRPKNYYNAKYFYPFHLQENLETANKICQRFQDTENPPYRGEQETRKKIKLCLISPQPVSMPSSSSRFISTRTCTVVVLLPRISCTSESLGSVWSWESKPFITPSWIWLKSWTPSDPHRLFSGRGRLSVGEPSTKRIYRKRKTFNKK